MVNFLDTISIFICDFFASSGDCIRQRAQPWPVLARPGSTSHLIRTEKFLETLARQEPIGCG